MHLQATAFLHASTCQDAMRFLIIPILSFVHCTHIVMHQLTCLMIFMSTRTLESAIQLPSQVTVLFVFKQTLFLLMMIELSVHFRH